MHGFYQEICIKKLNPMLFEMHLNCNDNRIWSER